MAILWFKVATSFPTEDAAVGHRFTVRLYRGGRHSVDGRRCGGQFAAAPAVRRREKTKQQKGTRETGDVQGKRSKIYENIGCS